jgi:hypothetical protein
MKNKAHQAVRFLAFAAILCMCCLSCKKDEPTQPAQNFCSRIGVSNNQPSISIDCSNISSTVSNIQYDQFSRVISFDFDFKCNTSSERYTGKFYDVQRNSIGQIISFQATVIGQSCRWPS